MTEFILTHEANIRLGVFISILLIMMSAEALFPRKARVMRRTRRWTSNLLLIIIDGFFVRLLFPIVAVGIAALSLQKGWGLFNIIDLPIWLEITLAIILLDVLIYWQHVAFHHIPFLWALHKVHHADRDIDVTTGSRFHPLEIGLSMVYKMALVALLGAPVLAVIIFEIILNVCAMFNHSNVKLPLKFDRLLRRLIVTPDMHRVHHSIISSETNSNFGFSLSLWDHLFGSYTAQPAKGHDDMVIGLQEHQTPGPASLSWSLALPFKSVKKIEKWL
ncbi:MAG: sterol desaturase family protein [Hellea sp.]